MGESGPDYKRWKENIPLLYDWFINHNLYWPSLSCRWGCVRDSQKYKRKQQIYLSERTDGSEVNKLLVMVAEITVPHVAAAEAISSFNEKKQSPFILPHATILHPGEVNKIREIPQYPHIIVTHSDSRELFVWNTEKQRSRTGERTDSKAILSLPDLILTGHTDIAEFALATSSVHPLVASGGKDTNVLIWDLTTDGQILEKPLFKNPAPQGPMPARGLTPKFTLKGHTDTVEDVVFKPLSKDELASVGDDKSLRLWDTRVGESPITTMEKAHGAEHDVHCVDWSSFAPNLIATGAADGTLKIWDPRKLGSADDALHTFAFHTDPIMRVEWAPYKAGVVASAGDDRMICVWDLNRQPDEVPQYAKKKGKRIPIPTELMFQHAGHRAGVADFQWHPTDPYTMMSVSDNGNGGTLQIWRINDLIWRDKDEVIKQLEPYHEFIIKGKGKQPEFDPPARLEKLPPKKRKERTKDPAKEGKGKRANGKKPAESARAAVPLGENAAAEVTPADVAAADKAPAESAPGENAASELAPGDKAPAESAPGDKAPAEVAPSAAEAPKDAPSPMEIDI